MIGLRSCGKKSLAVYGELKKVLPYKEIAAHLQSFFQQPN
jgi:hypothetical protein